LFIEFAGTPKSGKSSCIEIVRHFFRRVGFRVLAPTEGASRRTPSYLKDNLPAFNTWSGCYALTHVLEGNHDDRDRYQIALLDRGLFDALAWFELLRSEDEINNDEVDAIQRFFSLELWRSSIGIVFLFKTDPETSMKREHAHTLIGDPGRTMNTDFLLKLNQAYDTVSEKFKDHYRLSSIDTSDAKQTTPESTAQDVVTQILDVLDERLS
ncbi:MAG: hypothetical protein OXD46_11755, partial [Chloroflexi bacterium]|nr:hypothetical protein [Chloroflexota bacterium]